MKETKFKCSYCGKVTAGRLSRDKITGAVSDGSARFPRRHKFKGKDCPGNIIEAIWITI